MAIHMRDIWRLAGKQLNGQGILPEATYPLSFEQLPYHLRHRNHTYFPQHRLWPWSLGGGPRLELLSKLPRLGFSDAQRGMASLVATDQHCGR